MRGLLYGAVSEAAAVRPLDGPGPPGTDSPPGRLPQGSAAAGACVPCSENATERSRSSVPGAGRRGRLPLPPSGRHGRGGTEGERPQRGLFLHAEAVFSPPSKKGVCPRRRFRRFPVGWKPQIPPVSRKGKKFCKLALKKPGKLCIIRGINRALLG